MQALQETEDNFNKRTCLECGNYINQCACDTNRCRDCGEEVEDCGCRGTTMEELSE